MRIQALLASASAFALLAACTPADEAETTTAAGSSQVENTSTDTTAASEQSETERLYAWFQQEFESEIEFSPIGKTYLGMIDDLDAYGRWDDPSEAAFRAGLQRSADRQRYMRENFDYDALTPEAQVTWRFSEFIHENNAQQSEFWDHNYVFSSFFGPHTGLASTLIGYHRIDNLEHAEAYLSRLETVGDVLNVYTQQADDRAQAGVIAPAFAYPIIIGAAERFITGAPFDDSGEDSPLWGDIQTKLAGIDIDDDTRQALLDRAETALLTSVGPAYDHLIATMQAHGELAGEANNGAWALPDGEAFYRSQLMNYTTRTDMTADQIHQTGLDEVERIHGEMRQIMETVGFEGSLQDFFEHLRTSDEFYYEDSDEGRQRYLSESAAMIDQISEAAPEFFGQLPRAELEVRAVEDYRITTATGAFYESGSLDGTRPGAYYVNLANMRENPTYLMESLAYHEGAPGHHFQSSLAQELENAPMFQRLQWYSAYGEGWALYAENLGKDMGFFTDPYQDFGRLSYEVFRAARLVVDTGIHHLQWTEQEAADYMLATTPMPEGDIANEVRRYMVWPGQAVSYKVGMLTILDLRQRAMDQLGDDFSYGEFHDIVLTNGSIPLTLLEELVDAWIAHKLAE
ncbi:hypothetical protein AWH62_07940 [Maricaulis sp. W15]|uniref:Uncharacterized protein (DUF885 family) n=1 Tax=Maricaulis maris TaxID=74318 RepID=A0A495DCU0_9PROT|nr:MULTISPECIES: DUF885 domain-containing protein [Maricaulis]OLF74062.1 hypothetical protein AWH62_07940 [Maricaulis sp. W15]RKR00138.1 uncharacterized protein (DUF885 family) [Maricaulis maris]